MANDNSFKETMNNWMDKAEGFLDSLMDNGTDIGNKAGEHTRRLDSISRASKEELREEARTAKRNLKEQTDEITDRLDRWIDQVKQRAAKAGDVSDEQLRRFKEKARRIREEIRQDSDLASDEIQRRYDRFTDGFDRIREDLKENEAAGNRRVNETSPINTEGDYHAADVDGTLNNYADRFEAHAEMTKERIRSSAEEAVNDIRDKAAELGIKS